jgi:hypothetical protein
MTSIKMVDLKSLAEYEIDVDDGQVDNAEARRQLVALAEEAVESGKISDVEFDDYLHPPFARAGNWHNSLQRLQARLAEGA